MDSSEFSPLTNLNSDCEVFTKGIDSVISVTPVILLTIDPSETLIHVILGMGIP